MYKLNTQFGRLLFREANKSYGPAHNEMQSHLDFLETLLLQTPKTSI